LIAPAHEVIHRSGVCHSRFSWHITQDEATGSKTSILNRFSTFDGLTPSNDKGTRAELILHNVSQILRSVQ
jgi:hypothetical protein